MSPSACKKKTEVISVVCSLSVSELAPEVKALEEQIIEKLNEAGRAFYAAVFATFQECWIEQRGERYARQRWRKIKQVTPFGSDLLNNSLFKSYYRCLGAETGAFMRRLSVRSNTQLRVTAKAVLPEFVVSRIRQAR
jgi:hypothetical protein